MSRLRSRIPKNPIAPPLLHHQQSAEISETPLKPLQGTVNLDAHNILRLQRHFGNQAVVGWVQRTRDGDKDPKKRKVNPEDRKEEEPMDTTTTLSNQNSEPTSTDNQSAIEVTKATFGVGRSNQDIDFFTTLPEELFDYVLAHVEYRDLMKVISLSRAFRNNVMKSINKRMLTLPMYDPNAKAPLQMNPAHLQGILKIMVRYRPHRQLAMDKHLNRKADLVGIAQSTLDKVTMALGWREYSSELRLLPDQTEFSLEIFSNLIVNHAKATHFLETMQKGKKANDDVSIEGLKLKPFPSQSGDLTSQSPFLSKGSMLNKWRELLAKHWAALQSSVGKFPTHDDRSRKQDRKAKEINDMLSKMTEHGTSRLQQGHNITVVEDPTGVSAGIVYSNRELSPDQISRIEGMSEQTDGQTKYFQVKGATRDARNAWDASLGIKRGQYPLPFHSEMQRLENPDAKKPWQLTYGGNVYNACGTCMAVYHAIGIRGGEQGKDKPEKNRGYRGAHGAHPQSIIVPTVRQNSVYLNHFLGPALWQELEHVLISGAEILQGLTDRARMSATDGGNVIDFTKHNEFLEKVSQIFVFLDATERSKEDQFYQDVLPAPLRTS